MENRVSESREQRVLLLAIILGVVGCGGSVEDRGAGDGGAASTTNAQAFLEATVGPEQGPAGPSDECHLARLADDQVFLSANANTRSPVADGTKIGGSDDAHAVHITCRVHSNPDETFDFRLGVLSFNQSFQLSGSVGETGATKGVSLQHIAVDGTFTGHDCAVTFGVQGMGAASGRIWGNFSCSVFEEIPPSTQCGEQGEFRFENCSTE